jgi:hypothetical protein
VATKENIFHFKSIVSKVHYLERDGFFYFMETEIWKDIIGFEGLYQVSSIGRVKSMARIFPGYIKITSEIIKTPTISKHGYFHVSLWKNNKMYLRGVHRLVAQSFIPNENEYQIHVNHINGNKVDNSVSNLDWVSVRENTSHGYLLNNSHINCIGVRKLKKNLEAWEVRTTLNGKRIQVGTFRTEQLAIDAKIKFENENGIKNKYLLKNT